MQPLQGLALCFLLLGSAAKDCSQLRGIALSPVLSLVQAGPEAPFPSCAASSQHLDSTHPFAPGTLGSALKIDWKVGAEGGLGL